MAHRVPGPDRYNCKGMEGEDLRMEQPPPTAPFTLHWVWHDDHWCLAKRDPNGSTFMVFYDYADHGGNANVILGPEAGVIQPPPLDKPVYLTRTSVAP